MFNLNFLADCKNLRLHFECSTNKSSDSSVESSIMNKMIKVSHFFAVNCSIDCFFIVFTWLTIVYLTNEGM